MNTIIPKWPRHVPTATLHDIILDSVFRDLPAEQIDNLVKDFDDKLDDANQEIADLRNEVEQLRERVAELEAELAHATDR